MTLNNVVNGIIVYFDWRRIWQNPEHLETKSSILPCLGTHIWMEYIGESALPLSFLSIALGSPPHIIGWLKPPKHMKHQNSNEEK